MAAPFEDFRAVEVERSHFDRHPVPSAAGTIDNDHRDRDQDHPSAALDALGPWHANISSLPLHASHASVLCAVSQHGLPPGSGAGNPPEGRERASSKKLSQEHSGMMLPSIILALE